MKFGHGVQHTHGNVFILIAMPACPSLPLRCHHVQQRHLLINSQVVCNRPVAEIINGGANIPWDAASVRIMHQVLAHYQLTPSNLTTCVTVWASTCPSASPPPYQRGMMAASMATTATTTSPVLKGLLGSITPGTTITIFHLLCRAINCWFPDDAQFHSVVHPKIERKLRGLIARLDREGSVVVYQLPFSNTKCVYWPAYTRGWMLPDWNGAPGGRVDAAMREALAKVASGYDIPQVAIEAAAGRQHIPFRGVGQYEEAEDEDEEYSLAVEAQEASPSLMSLGPDTGDSPRPPRPHPPPATAGVPFAMPFAPMEVDQYFGLDELAGDIGRGRAGLSTTASSDAKLAQRLDKVVTMMEDSFIHHKPIERAHVGHAAASTISPLDSASQSCPSSRQYGGKRWTKSKRRRENGLRRNGMVRKRSRFRSVVGPDEPRHSDTNDGW